jgi:hypothetical protein
MKFGIRGAFLRNAGVVILFGSSAFAQTVTMELTGPPPGPSLGGVYISPYTALIGPAGQTKATITGVDTTVICDDFTTDVSIETPPWQAVATNLSSIQGESSASTNLKFDQTDAARQQVDYTVAAYLATEILQAQAQGDVTTQGELSFALWGLFDINPAGPLGGTWITGQTLAHAQNDLQSAVNYVQTNNLTPGSFANVTVYTPCGTNGICQTPPDQTRSQEYIVVKMPEPSSPALLALYFVAMPVLALVFRRRLKARCS